MHITTKATNYGLTDVIRTLIEEKAESCAKLLGAQSDEALFEVEVGLATEKHRTGDIYRAEGNLTADGKLYRAEATADTMEKAIEDMRDEMAREISRARGRARGLLRRGGSAVKSFLRGFRQ